MSAPAIALGQHPVTELDGVFDGSLALESDLAAPSGKFGGLHAGCEKVFAHKTGTLPIPLPATAAGAFIKGLVGEIGVARIEGGQIMVAMHTEEIILHGAASVRHHTPGRVGGHHGVMRLLDFLLVLVHVGTVAQQVDEVDEGEFIFDTPDLDRGVITLALDLCHTLIEPVLHERLLDF